MKLTIIEVTKLRWCILQTEAQKDAIVSKGVCTADQFDDMIAQAKTVMYKLRDYSNGVKTGGVKS